eukprot:1873111-Karenia_brevis.AAC.1
MGSYASNHIAIDVLDLKLHIAQRWYHLCGKLVDTTSHRVKVAMLRVCVAQARWASIADGLLRREATSVEHSALKQLQRSIFLWTRWTQFIVKVIKVRALKRRIKLATSWHFARLTIRYWYQNAAQRAQLANDENG